MRRYGTQNRDITYTRRPGAYAIILGPKGMLLTYQAAPHYEYQLPGGGIDPGEMPLQALHREVMEETGWRIEPVRRLTAYKRFVFMPEYDIHAEKICHIYLARAICPKDVVLEDGHQAIWMPVDDAVGMIDCAPDAIAVSAFLNGLL
ncbi:MAG: NUDIX hydrolase [Pseudomonadota bacterium]